MQSIREIQNQRNTLANEININRAIAERLENIASNTGSDSTRKSLEVEIQSVVQAIAVSTAKIEAIDFCIGIRKFDAGLIPDLSREPATFPTTKPNLSIFKFTSKNTINVQATVRELIVKRFRGSHQVVPLEQLVAVFRDNGVYEVRGRPIASIIRVALYNLHLGPKAILTKHDAGNFIGTVYRTI